MNSAARPASQGTRVRQLDQRNAPKSTEDEVQRFLELDKHATAAKLKVMASSASTSRATAPGAPRQQSSKAKARVDLLCLDVEGSRQRRALVDSLKSDPKGELLDKMLQRSQDRQGQCDLIEKRMQPSMAGIAGPPRAKWEYQVMLAKRHSDDGAFLSDDFFAVLDSKSLVSEALTEHHSTAEIRSAVAHQFETWVEQVQAEQPGTQQEVELRLQEVRREQATAVESQRIVDETITAFSQNLTGLSVVGVDLERLSKQASWSAANAEKRRLASLNNFSRTRHAAVLTDLSFRCDVLDPTADDAADDDPADGIDDDDDDGSCDLAGGLVGKRRSGGGGMSEAEHNRQLSILERKLAQRFETMMDILKTQDTERRTHRTQVEQLCASVEQRETEIVRLRSMYAALVSGRGFTEVWDVARELRHHETQKALHAQHLESMSKHKRSGSPAGDEGQPFEAPPLEELPVRDLLREVVLEVLAEAKGELSSLNGELLAHLANTASTAASHPATTGGQALSSSGVQPSEETDEAAVLREVNDLRKKYASQSEELDALKKASDHQEELYQLLVRKFKALEEEHTQTQQLFSATEADRTEKSLKLVDSEKACRELQNKLAAFDREKEEELNELRKQHETVRQVLEKQIEELERQLMVAQGESQEEETPQMKLRKALAKLQEFEVQHRMLRGLNSTLDSKVTDLKEEVKQLLTHITSFVTPFLNHALRLREHVQGGTTERMLDSMRTCIWRESDELLLDCSNMLKSVMRHSSDPIFSETVTAVHQAVTMAHLKEVVEDPQRKQAANELHRLTAANRDLGQRLRRAELELESVRSNKSQVVDTFRTAMDKLTDAASAAVEGRRVDISEVPLDDGYGDGVEYFATGSFGEAPRDVADGLHAAVSWGGPTAQAEGLSQRSVPALRRASSAGDSLKQRNPRKFSLPASGQQGNKTRSPIVAQLVSDDPVLEVCGVEQPGNNIEFQPDNRMMNDSDVAEVIPPKRRSILLEGARRRSFTQGVLSLRNERTDEESTTTAGSPVIASLTGPSAAPGPAPFTSRDSSPSAESPLRRQQSSLQRRSSSVVIAPTAEPIAVSVGRLFQDDSTQRVLDEAFGRVQSQLEAALRERDAAIASGADMAHDMQQQLLKTAEASAATVSIVAAATTSSCYAVREMSMLYSRSVLGPIAQHVANMWVSDEAEGLLKELAGFPAASWRLVRRIVQLSVLHQVRCNAAAAELKTLKGSVQSVGDVMMLGLWRRRWLYRQRKHAETISEIQKELVQLHSRRFELLSRLAGLVELPNRKSASKQEPLRVATPPPPANTAEMQDAPTHTNTTAAAQRVVPEVDTADVSSATDWSVSGSPCVSEGGVLGSMLERVGFMLTKFFTDSGVGAHAATAESLTSSILSDSEGAWLGAIAPRCGLRNFDASLFSIERAARTWMSTIIRQAADFQKRIESESYLRFIGPVSTATDNGPALDGDALKQLMLDDPGDAAAVGAELDEALDDDVDGDPNSSTISARRPSAAGMERRHVALEEKCRRLETQHHDTKLALRKVLRDIAADRFVHIETKLYHYGAQLSSLSGEGGCPVCGKVVVTDPLRSLGHVDKPILVSVCTETDREWFDPQIPDAGSHTTTPPPTQESATCGSSGLPSLLAFGRGLPEIEHDAHDIPDVTFVPAHGRSSGPPAVSPLLWTLAPPLHTPPTTGDSSFAQPQEHVATDHHRPSVSDAAVQTASGVSACNTAGSQTDEDLVAGLLLAMLDRVQLGRVDVGSAAVEVLLPDGGRNVANSSVETLDPSEVASLHDAPGGPLAVQMPLVVERLQRFSAAARASIVRQVHAAAASSTHQRHLASGKPLASALPAVTAGATEQQTQAKFTQSIVEHRVSPTRAEEFVSLCITSSAARSTSPVGRAPSAGARAANRSADVLGRLNRSAVRPASGTTVSRLSQKVTTAATDVQSLAISGGQFAVMTPAHVVHALRQQPPPQALCRPPSACVQLPGVHVAPFTDGTPSALTSIPT